MISQILNIGFQIKLNFFQYLPVTTLSPSEFRWKNICPAPPCRLPRPGPSAPRGSLRWLWYVALRTPKVPCLTTGGPWMSGVVMMLDNVRYLDINRSMGIGFRFLGKGWENGILWIECRWYEEYWYDCIRCHKDIIWFAKMLWYVAITYDCYEVEAISSPTMWL